VVHLIHVADGAFPSDMATGDAEGVDEERRLSTWPSPGPGAISTSTPPLRYHHGDPAGRTDKPATPAQPVPPPGVDHLLDLQIVRGPDDVVLPPVAAPT